MEIERILTTATFAATAHCKQRRKYDGAPYVNHLLRVGQTAARAGLSNEAVMAGILHDIIEDTETTFEHLEGNFSDRTISLVRLLTKWWPDNTPQQSIGELKEEYYRRILEDDEAVNLKLLDRADNIGDAVAALPDSIDWAKSYLAETEVEFPALERCSSNETVKGIFKEAVVSLKKALSLHSRDRNEKT